MSQGSITALIGSAILLSTAGAPCAVAAAEKAPADALLTLEAARQVPPVEADLLGARYVAIGSSFAAGPMLPPAKPGAPARCGQSMNNYPTLLAKRFGMALVDRTCSGAKTEHVLGPWGDIPPQIEAVNEATRLVTVTIGGNDLSYIGDLFSATCLEQARKAAAAGRQVKPCAPLRVPVEADYLRVETQLNKIARRIRAAAPRARLVFVQYLTPLPAALCPVTPIKEADAAIVRRIGFRLAEITRRAAQRNKALVIEMNQSSAEHTPCDPEPWMIGAPKDYDGKQGMMWHLNLAGMKATADGIAYGLIENGAVAGNPGAPQSRTSGGETSTDGEPAT